MSDNQLIELFELRDSEDTLLGVFDHYPTEDERYTAMTARAHKVRAAKVVKVYVLNQMAVIASMYGRMYEQVFAQSVPSGGGHATAPKVFVGLTMDQAQIIDVLEHKINRYGAVHLTSPTIIVLGREAYKALSGGTLDTTGADYAGIPIIWSGKLDKHAITVGG